jgi:hypothetical protein
MFMVWRVAIDVSYVLCHTEAWVSDCHLSRISISIEFWERKHITGLPEPKSETHVHIVKF